MNPNEKHKSNLNKFGFTVIRNCFDKDTILEYKEKIVEYFSDENGNLVRNLNKNYRDGKEPTKPLALMDEYFDFLHTLFEDNNLMQVLKYVTDDKLKYCHHFDVHVDTVAGKGWHRDSLNNSEGRMAPNWKDLYAKSDFWSSQGGEYYQVYRVAIYCQDHVENEDGLFLMANSHSHDPIDSAKVRDLYVKTKVGDVIVFDARCMHRGGHKVVKGNYRSAIFFAMGKDNIFTDEHTAGALARQKYQNEIEDYNISDTLKKCLSENNIGH